MKPAVIACVRCWTVVVVVATAVTAELRADAPLVSVVSDGHLGPAASYGLNKILAALSAKGVACQQAASPGEARGQILLLAGLAEGGGPASRLLAEEKQPAPEGPESLVIRQTLSSGKPAWLLVGSDDRGLMYAELDVADRIGWSADRGAPFSEVRPCAEKPDAPERAVSIYTMNRAYWESRFYDERHWARYLDLLAENRFNTLVVIFGYENGGFLAPCYPYFFDVEQFPDVSMVGITRSDQQRNLAALKRLIRMAHDRGLQFTVGIWDHIYRGGVQGGGIPDADRRLSAPTPGLVWGVNESNLTAYTTTALARFLKLIPEVDAIQFRMHDESGLKSDEQEAFWRAVFKTMREHAPHVRFDARAKGLPDTVIEAALETGVNLRITTKYWMEQMGMPFHPTHINRQNQFDRRHSFADLLRYPQRYKMHWRLWNGGTSRLLLWGDPEYARRFVASTHLYDGDGFEVNEPLCTKMEAQPHDMPPFALLNAKHSYYDYEFERYWHFFQVFGRLGYNPKTPAEVWQFEFQSRFGAAGPHVENALHRASWILPRIVAACYPYSGFPMTRGWAERQRLGDLPAYAKAEGSDIEQFVSFDDEALNLIEGNETAKTRPPQTSLWFAETADAVLAETAAAEQTIGDRRSKEFDSTATDLRILANLAQFHARRIPAAVSYRLFERSGDVAALDEAIAYERRALEAWRALVRAAGDFYADDLMMGVRGAGLCGHWRDELPALEAGLVWLEQKRRDFRPPADARPAPRYRTGEAAALRPAEVIHVPPADVAPGKPLTVAVEVRAPAGVKWVRLRYRAVNQQLDYKTLPMASGGETNCYRAVIPAEDIAPEWDLMYFIETMDKLGHGQIYPDFERETPYILVHLAR
jgi:hypothetical protein